MFQIDPVLQRCIEQAGQLVMGVGGEDVQVELGLAPSVQAAGKVVVPAQA